jgi:hypothetical protein
MARSAALHSVRVAVREDKDVPGKNFEALIPKPAIRSAFDQQVVNDDVPGGLVDIRRQLARIGRLKAPRRRKLRVEKKRAIQLYSLQYL